MTDIKTDINIATLDNEAKLYAGCYHWAKAIEVARNSPQQELQAMAHFLINTPPTMFKNFAEKQRELFIKQQKDAQEAQAKALAEAQKVSPQHTTETVTTQG